MSQSKDFEPQPDALIAARRKSGRIVLSTYQESWPAQFAREAERLVALTRPTIYRAEHIGSTAVPGLRAKPVIDMLLAATSLDDVDRYCIATIRAAGYTYVESYNDIMPWRRFFSRDDAQGERTHHLHVVEPDSDFWRTHLLFRDYLRAHPVVAKQYGDLKAQLAPQFVDANKYGEAKGAFIGECMRAAEQWELKGRAAAQ